MAIAGGYFEARFEQPSPPAHSFLPTQLVLARTIPIQGGENKNGA